MFSRRRTPDSRDTPDSAPAADEAFSLDDDIPSGDAELMPSLRSRLFDRMTGHAHDEMFAYSRRIGPFVEVMCRDLPTHVTTLTDAQLTGRDLDLLFAAARKNTEVEPSDLSSVEVEGGGPLWLLEGDHFFVSSQLASLPSRIAERVGVPALGEGVLAVAPRRGSIIGVPLVDDTSLQGVGMLFDFLERFGDDTGFDGLYYIHDPEVSSATVDSGFSDGPLIQDVRGPDGPGGKPSVVVDGAFEDAMMRAGLINPGGR